ncbi:phage tail assembly protein [Novosphingobium sp. HII-3]|uniref:phage tail assembly protein n=1 Tax=Novosphingobium sp. HII-3 TaxID=2075565 RepID=UPI000CDA3033|nr:phage tail assembly protein [Novosphingobium sp. HII-3]
MSAPAELRTVALDQPITRGDQTFDTLQLRRPNSGELRGLSLVDLGQLKTDALIKVLPRITVPTITEVEAAGLHPADLLACGAEIGSFLLQKSQRTDALA